MNCTVTCSMVKEFIIGFCSKTTDSHNHYSRVVLTDGREKNTILKVDEIGILINALSIDKVSCSCYHLTHFKQIDKVITANFNGILAEEIISNIFKERDFSPE